MLSGVGTSLGLDVMVLEPSPAEVAAEAPAQVTRENETGRLALTCWTLTRQASLGNDALLH